MKIIFLDIDGVLNSILYSEINNMNGMDTIDCLGKPFSQIDHANLNILKLIVSKTDANIVISSTWRKDGVLFPSNSPEKEKIAGFKKFFSQLGWEDPPIIGVTENLYSLRGHEVASYLDKIALTENIEDYIILDDDSDFILGELNDEHSSRLDKMGLLDIEDQNKKSKYWTHQHLLVTNKLTGLSYDNMIEILTMWSPEDSLVKENNAYKPYLKNYGKRF